MQALWSRAGQAHHCGCKACFNAAGGMIRQSATRVTPRKPTFSEIFTACYTGIMATAAVIDAKAKDKRRLELDRQLEEARAELDTLKKRRPRQYDDDSAPPGSVENRYQGSLWEHKRQKGEISEFLDSLSHLDSWAKPLPRSGEVNRYWEECGFITTKDSLARLKAINYADCDNRLMEEENRQGPDMAHRMPKTLQQLEMAELGMADLVDRMVRDSKKILQASDWEALQNEVALLRNDNMPRYREDSDTATVKACSAKLNTSLGAIFANESYDQRKKISKMCHNLLVSPQPPTIFTYNTLILGLNRSGLHSLAQGVVGAFFKSKVEPTRKTMACLLNHFRESGEEQRFFNVIQRMTGKDARGIKIRRKEIEDVLTHEQLFLWAAVKNVAIGNKYVVERAWFDVDIFTAIIQGMLNFNFVRHAAATFSIALKYGITFDVQTTSNLLEQCIYTLDTKAAQQILDAFQMKPRLIRATFRQEKDQQYLAGRIQNLIDICHLDQTPFSVAPWLQVSESKLPSEAQRRGMRIVSIIHQAHRAQKKIKKYQWDLKLLQAGVAPLETRKQATRSSYKKAQQPAQRRRQEFAAPNLIEETPKLTAWDHLEAATDAQKRGRPATVNSDVWHSLRVGQPVVRRGELMAASSF
ncbi:pentatricopeptide repeat domain-containing protein [Colletotrichum truncatum]|uniref:Pentatricopeptide repeat domain-containing protein n=1 Tax=Colletotrichum truncatum TaxID=5467 RepID=A0ACC3ZAK1_COLTU|nr:pentatricopeptide repeat domain-containing protein [Colletotrichum truncatum]KAF6796277.1 pentatricopeptide repeat domain-containing protein [Colletotrichum truncatum]